MRIIKYLNKKFFLVAYVEPITHETESEHQDAVNDEAVNGPNNPLAILIENPEVIKKLWYESDQRITGPSNMYYWENSILRNGDKFQCPEQVTSFFKRKCQHKGAHNTPCLYKTVAILRLSEKEPKEFCNHQCDLYDDTQCHPKCGKKAPAAESHKLPTAIDTSNLIEHVYNQALDNVLSKVNDLPVKLYNKRTIDRIIEEIDRLRLPKNK